MSESVELMGNKSSGGDSGVRCDYCSKFGHTEDKCYTKQRDLGGETNPDQKGKKFPRGKGGCAICHQSPSGRKYQWLDQRAC